MTEYLILDVVIAYCIDLMVGDPYWLPHPVRFIGALIKRTENFLRKSVKAGGQEGEKAAGAERRAGIVLMVFVVAVAFSVVLLLLKLAALVHPLAFHGVNIYFIYSALAARCLGDEAGKVYRALESGDMDRSRKQLAMLVGRDTEGLDEKEIIRGVVETTAENTVDGVISPLFYALAGSVAGLGAPLVYAFKAISTLDSMVGYMNEKYIHLGRASAKTDDAANYLPARLSGILMPLGAFLCGLDFKKSFVIMLRDRRNHKSPNCAYPEAATAGALGIRIGGTNVYFGKAVEKPTIGDPDREIDKKDIPRTVRLMHVSSALALLLGALAALALIKVIY